MKGRVGIKEEREGRSSKEKAEEFERAKKMEELARKRQNTTQKRSKSTGAAGVKKRKTRRIRVRDQLRQMLCMLPYIPKHSKRGYRLGVGAMCMPKVAP